jgi:prefoldin beta subunit
MNEQEKRELMMEFERNRQMLGNISSQKQQYQVQVEVIKASLEELETTKEETVMKIIGNILVNKKVSEMKKELEEQKETFSLRLKTLEKQEETIIKKLNSIRSKVEGKSDSEEGKEKTKEKNERK